MDNSELPILIKELELSQANAQKCSDYKSTFVTITIAIIGIVATLFHKDLLRDEYLTAVPFVAWGLFLLFWNQDFNHIAYLCGIRRAEAKINAIFGKPTFTWERDHYRLTARRRPLKHVFNAIVALMFMILVGTCGFFGAMSISGNSSLSWLYVIFCIALTIAIMILTGRAIQSVKRESDKMVDEISRHGLPETKDQPPHHEYGLFRSTEQ